ncbi:hypothetical protein TUM3792_18060 [Shewanella sp. MBTL60-007]|nr:hypothetical protein TUM3792_18060 [Shewanella sp. MBTL60-007]
MFNGLKIHLNVSKLDSVLKLSFPICYLVFIKRENKFFINSLENVFYVHIYVVGSLDEGLNN